MARNKSIDARERPGDRRSKRTSVAVATVVAVSASILAGAATKAGADDDQLFRTAAGHDVPMPAIGELDCRQMAIILEQIDASGYRPGNPNLIDPADRPLFNYEGQLSAAHYESCSMGETGRKRMLHGFKLMTIPTSQ